MADIHRFSERVIDLAERLEDVADAAKGKGNRKGGLGTRWLLLPAAGAGVYALVSNGSFARSARGVMEEAKSRASELPDDLMSRIRQASRSTSGSAGQARRRSSSNRSNSRSTRKTASTR